jgi:protein-L-isoaspartate(D-aspartate) O-methyltransferase
MALVDYLIKNGWLTTPAIIEAFKKIKRADFLPTSPIGKNSSVFYKKKEIKQIAEINEALPIGYGQTISQPAVVAFMLEELKPKAGDKVLDIGFGSGWTAALLAYIVSSAGKSKKGKVIAIERIPELKEFGEKNIAKYSFIKKGTVKCICADGSVGFRKEAPFDKILVSARAETLFSAWKEQLSVGGRIVLPIDSSIWRVDKKSNKLFEKVEYPGFAFVPLIVDDK